MSTLSSNSDGKGVLSIAIAPGVRVKTYNNSFSDIGADTLLKPASSLFQRASSLSVGQKVQFSGRFIGSVEDCIREVSLTLDGSITEPEFIIKFSDVSPLN